ncbi:MAG: diaminopimelate epimerase [Prevotellaceae bacterium]|jgi:diaminopimelate epimerase|nr:diaminopimelate epimerase [Prevotellaceae bacterium]
MKFTKMHGAGNDYIYINGFAEDVSLATEDFIKRVSDRHFGIGSDGVVLILPSETCDFRMQMFNSDGSEAEMCGNASRCVGKYVYDKGLTDKQNFSLETKAGVKILQLNTENGVVKTVRVDMGEPILEAVKIPVIAEKSPVINLPLEIDGKTHFITCVSMGNPHAVVFQKDIENFEIEKIGAKFENNPIFPRRTNTEFVEIVSPQLLKMRVWERGAGETLACGTGACASLVAAVLNGFSDRKATLKLLGGDLQIEWNEADNHVYMTGEAAFVFEGEVS